MIYPANALDKLGFSDIKELVKARCISEPGRQLVDRMQPQKRFEQIDRFLRQTHELKSLLENDAPLPVDHLYPIWPLAQKAKVEGGFLVEEEFFQLMLSVNTVFAVIRYFGARDGEYPHLETLFEGLEMEKGIVTAIAAVIDAKGTLKDNASPLLLDITNSIAKAEQEARKRIDQVFRHAQQQGWTADGNLTVREGRLCIPVLAENKRKVKGFVHDESATGQTVYIEPEEVFHLNNKVRDLAFERRREAVRILVELTNTIRPYVPLLQAYHGFLAKLDFVRAKALFASELGATMPMLSQEATLQLVNARHPLLLINFRKEGQTVVPLNISIDDGQRIIVVSGPNAGGKSVCLKTVGLLQLMAQAGLLIPADEVSVVGVFTQFLVDIGDDQSIESDLSTYSAHLSKMKYFTEHAHARSIVFVDEFGTGTDPLFGGPMAEAVLEALNRKNVRGVITTHYSNLKVFASNTDGVDNASMLFDNEAMRPLYILQTGKPGSSYAFEIAEKIGLRPDILRLAKQKVGKQQKRVDTLLVDLERDKKDVVESKAILARQEKELERLKAENESLQAYLAENRKSILAEAKQEARRIIRDANKLVENTVSEIKAVQADREKTKALRLKLQAEAQKHEEPKAPKAKPAGATSAAHEFQPGDWVRIESTGAEAEILEVAKNNLILAIGDLRTVQKKSQVTPLPKKNKQARKSRSGRAAGLGAVSEFSSEIDVRGMRTEEALYEIEKQLDKALMTGYPSMRIVHGRGDGILRKFIREYLRKYSQVTRVEDEHPDRGGDGVTYAYLD